MLNELSCEKHFLSGDKWIQSNSRRTLWVLWITLVTMAAEIYFGWLTGSMALLADGWHMGTHAAALGIAFLTYKLATNPNMARNFNFGGGKLIALGGFASAVFLVVVVCLIAAEAVDRFFQPIEIHYNDALLVAFIGLVVNFVSALLLAGGARNDHSHGHSHQHGHNSYAGHSHAGVTDHNIRAAFVHVVADALTSVAAIGALLSAKYLGWTFLDPAIAVVSSLVILKWAYNLVRDTGWELLDGHAEGIDFTALRSTLEQDGAVILDLHVWKVGPSTLASELVVRRPPSGASKGIQHYRAILETQFGIQHSVIEER